MKILTKEEERAHFESTVKGGVGGGLVGLLVGGLGIYGASARYPAFRALSLPFRAFLLTSTTSFSAVIAADRYSRAFEKSRHADADYRNQSEALESEASSQRSTTEKIKTWVSEQRYPIVFGSWAASMAIAFGIVSRNPYLTGQQKLVQARVYAQALTLAVLVGSFALESNDLRAGKGRWETIKVLDPDDPQHKKMIEKRIHHEAYTGEDQWMDMIDSEERKLKDKGKNVRIGEGKDSHKHKSGDSPSSHDNNRS